MPKIDLSKFSEFDSSEYLTDEEIINAYLREISNDPEKDMDLVLYALGQVARARGIAKVAEDSGLNRESLYKVFKPSAKPQFETVTRVLDAMGFELQVRPKAVLKGKASKATLAVMESSPSYNAAKPKARKNVKVAKSATAKVAKRSK